MIVLAAITRVIAAFVLGDRLHFIDEAIYVDAARELLGGGGYGAMYQNVPAQPVFLAVLAAPWSSSVLLVRVLQALVTGLLGGTILWALGTRTVGMRATLVALVVYALDPLVVVAGALLYPEGIAAVVLAGAVLAAVIAAQDDRVGASVVAGALLGLTILFRPVATVLIPFLALWVAGTLAAPPIRRMAHGLAVVVACAIAVSPWVVSNLLHEGQIIPASLAGLQNAPVPRSDMRERGIATSIGREAVSNPVRIVRRIAGELGAFWELYPTRLQTDSSRVRASIHREDARLPERHSFPPTLRDTVSAVSFGAEAAFALIGLVLGLRRRRDVTLLLAGVALLYGLGYALFLAKLRYRIVVLPGVFLLAGFGAWTLYAELRERFGRRPTHA